MYTVFFSCRWGTFIHLVAITELPNPFRRKNNATDSVGMNNTDEDDEHEMTNAETLKQIESLQRFGLFNIIRVQSFQAYHQIKALQSISMAF